MASTALETRADVLEVASELGVSERQLRRWRDEGLLPRAFDQRWLGRGLGSATFYPAGSCRQLREIVRWFAHDRRVDIVRWALWCNGFPVDPDPHARILEALRHPTPARRKEDLKYRGDFVAYFAAMLRTVAEQGKDFQPHPGQPIADALRDVAPSVGFEGMPEIAGPLGSDLERLFASAVRQWDILYLVEYLTAERLVQLRDRARLLYQLWAPERAEVEPLPPRILIAMIVLNAIGIPIGMVVDYLIRQPEAADAGRRLRDWLLDDTVRSKAD